jgi:predicted GNAT family acetyltransferase
LKKGDNVFSPKPINVHPYFTSHTSKSFISIYHENEFVADHKNGSLEEFKKIVGVITSRPVHISIWKKDVQNTMDAYYVDYLCVHDDHRKKGIAPQMIQTHHYYQRHMNKNIVVGLFKREGDLTGIVPICVYKTYGFSVKKWVKPPEFPAYYTLLEINPQNFSSLYDFLKKTAPKYFDIHIHTEITNIIELLKTKNLFIYVLMNHVDQEIQCAYFFKKSCVFIENDLEVLTCIGSVNDSTSNNDFFHKDLLSPSISIIRYIKNLYSL